MYPRQLIDNLVTIHAPETTIAVADVGLVRQPEKDHLATPKQLENRRIILSVLNTAYIELHRRFTLRIDTIKFDQVYTGMIVDYPTNFISLLGTYWKDGQRDMSILTQVQPFKADILPDVSELKKQHPEKYSEIRIRYKAAPDTIDLDTFVDLGLQYNTPFLNYCAYLLFLRVSPSNKADNNTYLQRYYSNCAEIEASSDVLDSSAHIGLPQAASDFP